MCNHPKQISNEKNYYFCIDCKLLLSKNLKPIITIAPKDCLNFLKTPHQLPKSPLQPEIREEFLSQIPQQTPLNIVYLATFYLDSINCNFTDDYIQKNFIYANQQKNIENQQISHHIYQTQNMDNNNQKTQINQQDFRNDNSYNSNETQTTQSSSNVINQNKANLQINHFFEPSLRLAHKVLDSQYVFPLYNLFNSQENSFFSNYLEEILLQLLDFNVFQSNLLDFYKKIVSAGVVFEKDQENQIPNNFKDEVFQFNHPSTQSLTSIKKNWLQCSIIKYENNQHLLLKELLYNPNFLYADQNQLSVAIMVYLRRSVEFQSPWLDIFEDIHRIKFSQIKYIFAQLCQKFDYLFQKNIYKMDIQQQKTHFKRLNNRSVTQTQEQNKNQQQKLQQTYIFEAKTIIQKQNLQLQPNIFNQESIKIMNYENYYQTHGISF